MSSVAAFHVEQAESNGCVVACIAMVMMVSGPPYVARKGVAPGGAPSRHGDLCAPSGLSSPCAPYHVVLIVGQSEEGYLYLDPYYPVDGQPLLMTEDEIVAVFAYQVAVTPAVVEIGAQP